MINNVVISGYYKGFDFNNLLLQVNGIKNNQTVKIYINDFFKCKLEKILKADSLIGIKGYIDIDDRHEITVIATKITFLSNK